MDQLRFAHFGDILDNEANWKRCLHGSVTASDGMTLILINIHLMDEYNKANYMCFLVQKGLGNKSLRNLHMP